MLSDNQIWVNASITLHHGISTRSHDVLEPVISVVLNMLHFFPFFLRECQGMPDFHVNPNKDPIVHPALLVQSLQFGEALLPVSVCS